MNDLPNNMKSEVSRSRLQNPTSHHPAVDSLPSPGAVLPLGTQSFWSQPAWIQDPSHLLAAGRGLSYLISLCLGEMEVIIQLTFGED